MKIVIVYQHYLMPNHPGGSRFNEFAWLWSAAGHEVTVLAGNPDYATGVVPARYRGRWVAREADGAVTLMRCIVPATYTTGYTGCAQALLGFTLAAATAAATLPRPDVVIATSPPLVALEADATRRGLANVMFCGLQPRHRMADFVNACDLGAAVLQDNPTFRTVYPHKVFDCMACERPTLLAIAAVIRARADDPAGNAAMGCRGQAWVLAHA
jgi:hypothetical protein